jgi:hypothetical protein
MPLRIRCWCRSRSRSGLASKQCGSSCGSYTQILHMLQNQNFFTSSHSIATLQCLIFLITVKCVICFQYFRQHIEIFWKKQLFYVLVIDMVPIRIGWIRICTPWMTISIRFHNTDYRYNSSSKANCNRDIWTLLLRRWDYSIQKGEWFLC